MKYPDFQSVYITTFTLYLPSLILKKAMESSSRSACSASCSELVAISSDSAALLCEAEFNSCMAVPIWSAPVFCSMLVAEISCTKSAVFVISGITLSILRLASSVLFTVRLAREMISSAATLLLSANFLTSAATTANPFPLSPARAASTAAFRASIFVWKAISFTILILLLICLIKSKLS